MDRVTSMHVFVRAASEGSLSAAARHLGMPPAMATKHVNALEARLGVKLFCRTTRRLGNSPMRVCAAPDYPDRRGASSNSPSTTA
ncbi:MULTISPECIES: helix-turn-helix domain-containing protein [Rhodanobacter]|uniref:helix-turn-helix domain-containing protein n=1 Tax=Rhodanobacter TaxID=75309 RepID=UPI00041DDF0C|nr:MULTISPECIES: LysR family transcriptional regulator [Rhodanobacter]UJJ54390.1 LysR family transcriptional regulator [Rhodanobacter thiooxydans]